MISALLICTVILLVSCDDNADPHVMFYFNPANSLGVRQLRELRKNIERARERVKELSALQPPVTEEEQTARRNEMFGAAIMQAVQQLSVSAHANCDAAQAALADPCVTVDYIVAQDMCRVTYKCKIDTIYGGQKSVSAISADEAQRRFKTAVQ